MTTIFYRNGRERNAFINPCDLTKKVPGFPKVCITTYSEGIIRDFTEINSSKIIAKLHTANGMTPVYETEYKNRKMGLFLSRVGAPACVAGLEEIIAMGAEKIVQFGCCGILDQSLAGGKLIVPVSAVRDEGTSYHYIAPDEEIRADSAITDIAAGCMERHHVPYVTGKVWTTDAIYRETPELIKERRAQGCIGVEMECAASMAVARFRKVPLLQFLYGADSLDGDKWDPVDLTDYGMASGDIYMALALECALALERTEAALT